MSVSDLARALIIGTGLAGLLGCGGEAKDRADGTASEEVSQAVASPTAAGTGGIDPATYAGRFQIKYTDDVPIAGAALPVTLYAGLDEETETRLKVNAFADLQAMQAKLPETLSGVLDETCSHKITLDLFDVTAEQESVRATGSVRAEFTRCKGRDTPEERAGWRFFSATVGAIALGKAEAKGQCLNFTLVDVDLDPKGFIGGVSNLFGLTKRINSLVVQKAGEYLDEHPVCLNLPAEFATLEPRFDTGGAREIGDGGLGAAVSGSVDVSATTQVALLKVLKDRGVIEELK